MKNLFLIALLILGIFACKPKSLENKDTPTTKISADAIVYYETVPGAPVSKHFVSEILVNGKWCKSATLETESSEEGQKINQYDRRYYPMNGWTMSWTSFEIPKGTSVQLRIKRIDGLPFDSWSLKPGSKNIPAKKEGDWLVLTIDKPCQLVIDPNNELNNFNLGTTDPSSVKLHNMAIFVNPHLEDSRPYPGDPNVYCVKPGELPPEDGDWQTVYFLPGEHHINRSDGNLMRPYFLKSDKKYYIPGDAFLYGTMYTKDSENVHLFGYGTVSGLKNPWPKTSKERWEKKTWYKLFNAASVKNLRLEGIYFCDAAFHTVAVYGKDDPNSTNYIKNLKISTWCGNGDGFYLTGYAQVEDCFLRCQDDCIYTGSGSKGMTVSGLTTWTDYNGSAFIFTAGGSGQNVKVSNCDIIYSRSKFAYGNGAGGRVFNLRSLKKDASITNISFEDIRIDDPNRNEVFYVMAREQKLPPREESGIVGPGKREYIVLGPDDNHEFSNILFKDIEIVHDLGLKSKFYGSGKNYSVTFDNVTIGGKKATKPEDLHLDVKNFPGLIFK